jgi:hypothetical protein
MAYCLPSCDTLANSSALLCEPQAQAFCTIIETSMGSRRKHNMTNARPELDYNLFVHYNASRDSPRAVASHFIRDMMEFLLACWDAN